MAVVDLNSFDVEQFETDEAYQDEVRSTPAGLCLEVLATSLTLQDCGEYLALTHPEALVDYFLWAEKNYPELDIDPHEAVRLVKEAVRQGTIGIEKP